MINASLVNDSTGISVMSRIFISHTHADKPIARRVARRLSAYGVAAWLDERELRLGEALGTTIESHLRDCEMVVVIATAAASKSQWVARELSFAAGLAPARPICPLLVEPVQKHSIFTDHLGLDATTLHGFEAAVGTLATAVLGTDLPEPNREVLLAAIEDVAREEPALALLVEGCRSGIGLSETNMETVMNASFHPLDFAVNALFDSCPVVRRELIASIAACAFKLRGAGTYVLKKHARTGTGGDRVVDVAVGTKLRPEELDAAFDILSACPHPDDQALASFISHNASSFSGAQRKAAVKLATYPKRPPHGFTVDAAVSATKLAPGSKDMRMLWMRWIKDGEFDGHRGSVLLPDVAISALKEFGGSGEQSWDDVTGELRSHVRRLARTPDRKQVKAALEYVRAAANRNSPVLAVLASECQAAVGSAEWDAWTEREEMSIYVSEFVSCAHGDRRWGDAYARFKSTWADVQSLNTELEKQTTVADPTRDS